MGWSRALIAAFALVSLCAPARAQTPAPLELKVMTFNVWYGGEQVNFATVIDAIRAADPDIVGVQEPDGNLARIAAAAGYAYVDPRRNIVARYPIFDSGTGVRTEAGAAPYGVAGLDAAHVQAWVMVRPGEIVAVANTHLTSDPYGPEAVRDGAGREHVLALERRVRLPEAQPLFALGALGAAGTPTFLTGDFNAPSHLDWTAAAQRARPERVRYPLAWPVALGLAEAGLRDSYREAHPDPVAVAGYTWTAGMPHPYVRPRETLDRIDFVFSAGPAITLDSRIVGEPGGRDVDIPISPYPSDHRAVVSTFRVTPAPAPALIAVEPHRVLRGADFLVRGYDPDSEGWRAVIVPRGGAVEQARLRADEPVAAWRRAARFSSAELAAGEYHAVLLDEAGRELNRVLFAVTEPESAPTLQALTQSVRVGRSVRVRWADAPGNRHDWIGIFRAGEVRGGDYLAFAYVDARFSGEMDVATVAADGPLPAGAYELRLMRDDTTTVLARAPFTIAAR